MPRMNNTKRLLYNSIIMMFLLLSCKKNIVDDYPSEAGCEKFAGEYLMYDPFSDTSYIMTIECKPEEKNIEKDTLTFKNYGNRFNFKMGTSYALNDVTAFGSIIIQPLLDHEGNRWTFSNVGYEGPDDRLNRLVGDSLYINFSIDNALYYLEDSIPYYYCNDCSNYGIKIH